MAPQPTKRSSGGWKFLEPTLLRSLCSGKFQPPSVRQCRTNLPASVFVIWANPIGSEAGELGEKTHLLGTNQKAAFDTGMG